MAMPDPGEYLFTGSGFSHDGTYYLALEKDGIFTDLRPHNTLLSLQFNTSQRYCVGWRDITKGEQFCCPDSSVVDAKYEQCSACQQRTGFNPAFYNATQVSKQQEQRNTQPHTLYLAHFAQGVVKVGISFAGRGTTRLLEQGARSAVILDTFPSALIARQYEAQIAALPGIAETIQLRKKIETLSAPYTTDVARQELISTKNRIEHSLGKAFAGSDVLSFEELYFPAGQPKLADAYDCTEQHTLSGTVTGMLGSLLFTHLGPDLLFLPMKKHVGYKVHLFYEPTDVLLPARQTSLF